jgi:predicted aldo/keto reductase-like oxidoreductase
MIAAKTPDKIHHEISKMLSNGVSYIDALVDYSKKENMEIETLAEIVKKSEIMREKIREEGVRLRMVKDDSNATGRLF